MQPEEFFQVNGPLKFLSLKIRKTQKLSLQKSKRTTMKEKDSIETSPKRPSTLLRSTLFTKTVSLRSLKKKGGTKVLSELLLRESLKIIINPP